MTNMSNLARKAWDRLHRNGSGVEVPTDPEMGIGNGLEPDSPAADAAWAAGESDVGRRRRNNEDSYLCALERGLFVVCDGMGGQAAGEEASREAVREIDELLSTAALTEALAREPVAVEELLVGAMERANASILRIAEEHPDWEGMGTTAVIALLSAGSLHLASLGDSRAYLFRGAETSVLTNDHSVAADLLAAGQLTAEEARHSPLRNRLTRCLGVDPLPPPFTACFTLQTGDRVLLCSDGLWDMLEDDQITRIATSGLAPSATVRALVEAANACGGHDNITAIVVEAVAR